MLECGKTCTVIFLSLILMTAGFVLTLMGWFAPPLNNFVLNVRMGGPIALLVGFVFLLCSCLMCAVEQGKCCHCCRAGFKDEDLLPVETNQTGNGPVIRRESEIFAESAVDDLGMYGDRASPRVDRSMVMVNHRAEQDQPHEYDATADFENKHKLAPSNGKGYHTVATEDDVPPPDYDQKPPLPSRLLKKI